MKILFAAPEGAWDGFLSRLRRLLPEHEFVASGRFGIDSLAGFDVLIPTMTPVDAECLSGADRLRLVQQVGSGVEGVDIAAAERLDIRVANVPAADSGNADSVAELGIYLMLALARRAPEMHRNVASGVIGTPFGMALMGKTCGIVGLGGIGAALARRLTPFGMRLAGVKRHDPQLARAELGLDWAGGMEQLPQLLGMSDFVVLCLPDTPATHHLMDYTRLAMMKPGAFLVNLGRGGLLPREALLDALAGGRLGGAGLDVFWAEPADPDDPVFRYNVIATPHVGGSTDISTRGILDAVADNLRRLDRGLPLNHLLSAYE